MSQLQARLHVPERGDTLAAEVGWEDTALRVRAPGVDRLVPAAALSVSAGGWSGEALLLEWTEEGERTWAVSLEGPGAAEGLAEGAPAPIALELARLRRARLSSGRRRRLVLALVAALVLLPLAALAAAFALRGRILDAVVRRLPVSVDARLGELALEQVAASGLLLAEGPAVEAVRAVGERLVAAAPPSSPAPFRFRFEVLRDPTVNAFAAPGGLVVVHTGLLAAADSPDELAGVLAHEVSHVLHRHSLRQLVFNLGLVASVRLVLGSPEGFAGFAADVATKLGSLRFSREQEAAADRGGLDLLVRARLPADGLPRFFERLAREGGSPPALLSSHPPSEERSAKIGSAIAERGKWATEPLALDWAAVKREAQREAASPR
jgi:predicted Zn-dependent protease